MLGNPAGHVRLTLVDPLGSGQGLAVFRTLPEALRGERVLTTADEIDARLRRMGVSHILHKPFNPQELMDLIRDLLGAPRP